MPAQYANGKDANLGDEIVGRNARGGQGPVSGVVTKIDNTNPDVPILHVAPGGRTVKVPAAKAYLADDVLPERRIRQPAPARGSRA